MDRRDLTELEDLPFTGSSGFWTEKMTGADIFDCGDMNDLLSLGYPGNIFPR